MTDTDNVTRIRNIPIWAHVSAFYGVLAALHIVFLDSLPIEGFGAFQGSLQQSYAFVMFICLVGAFGAWAVQRKGVLIAFLVQVALSATLLMTWWLPSSASWMEQGDFPEDASFFLQITDQVGFGLTEENALLYRVTSVILCYLLLVPLVLMQWRQAGPSSTTQMQLPKLFTEIFRHSKKPDVDLPRMSADTRFIVEILQQSIAETKARAGWILRLIMLLLVAGVLVFVFAGRITSLDVVGSDATSSIERELTTLNNRRDRIEQSNQDLFDRQNSRMTALEATRIELEINPQTGEIAMRREGIGSFLKDLQGSSEFRDYIVSSFSIMRDFQELVRDRERALQNDAAELLEEQKLEIARDSALSFFSKYRS